MASDVLKRTKVYQIGRRQSSESQESNSENWEKWWKPILRFCEVKENHKNRVQSLPSHSWFGSSSATRAIMGARVQIERFYASYWASVHDRRSTANRRRMATKRNMRLRGCSNIRTLSLFPHVHPQRVNGAVPMQFAPAQILLFPLFYPENTKQRKKNEKQELRSTSHECKRTA